MHSKEYKKIPSILQDLINTSFYQEGKKLIDDSGVVLIENNEVLKIEEENLLTFLSPYFDELSIAFLQELTTKKIGFEGVFFLEKKSKWIRVMMSPIVVEEDVFFMVQFFDISKEKETEHQLVKHKKNIENEMLLRTQEIVLTDEVMSNDGGFLQNFLRGLRHDLISPITQLNEIINYYKAASDPRKKEKAEELIDDCLRKLKNTSKGFSDFVDLHFLPQMEAEELSFEKTLKETLVLLETEIKDTNALIEFDFSQKSHLRFNENLIGSIFYNLLSNALKFKSIDRALKIKIKTSFKDRKVILEVEDNGIGIDLDAYGHLLFVPFKRVNMSRPGAGIGLSLLKSILTKNDRGVIKLESTVGVGTKVQIVFNQEIF